MWKLYVKSYRSLVILLGLTLAACNTSSTSFNRDVQLGDSTGFLYVASGPCYGGGVTVSAGPANTVAKFDLVTGRFLQVVIDYNQLSPGDSPVSVADYDMNHLLVLVENASGRRIDLVNKDGTGAATYLVNTTALSGVTRAMVKLADNSLLVSKSTAVEKFNSAKARVLQGANPFINAPAGTCATATTLISSIAVEPTSGKIVFTHAAATTNNRIGTINATGYSVAADCNGGLAGPTTVALPTRAIFHTNGKLLVSYGSTTTTSNFIYSYDFNKTSGAITNPVAVFNDGGTVINGPSSMAVDPITGDVFVASVTSTYNTIERFHFVSNAMTRVSGPSFIGSQAYTRCISDLKVMQ